jgi:hypothetical protein
VCRLFKVIEWILFRSLVVTEGYSQYITVFYIMAAIVVATMLLTVWVALALKGYDTVNPWLRRWVRWCSSDQATTVLLNAVPPDGRQTLCATSRL